MLSFGDLLVRRTVDKIRCWRSRARRGRSRSTLGIAVALVTAAVAWGHGDRTERLEDLDARLETQPDSADLLLERADIRRRLGQHEQALADLERLLDISPGHAQGQYLLGLTHLDRESFAEAESALRRYLRAKPHSAAGHLALAQALTGQDRHLAAAREYERAIAAQPIPVPDHFLARARAYRDAGEPYVARAILGLDEGMRSLGPLITLQRLAIELELARRNPSGAIDRVDAVLAGVERKETWLVTKARILADAGRQREAEATLRLAGDTLGRLPHRIRSSPAMVALADTITKHLEAGAQP